MQETPVPEIIALNASIRRPETRQTERGDQFQRDIRRRQPFRRINTNLQQTTDPGCEKCGLGSQLRRAELLAFDAERQTIAVR